MKTLLLLRHAKSSWADPGQQDFDRPLNERGRRNAPQIGQVMVEQRMLPDVILTSTANRALQTLEGMKTVNAELRAIPVETDDRLYHASPEQILAVVRARGAEHDRVLVIGHNPGMQELLYLLTGCAEDLPTAALAIIELPVRHWTDVTQHTAGRLTNLFRPKDL